MGLFLLFISFKLILHLLFVSGAISFTLSMSMSDFSKLESCDHCFLYGCQFIESYNDSTIKLYGALSVSVPIIGSLSLYFTDYLWLQKYLASVCLMQCTEYDFKTEQWLDLAWNKLIVRGCKKGQKVGSAYAHVSLYAHATCFILLWDS